MRIGADDGRRLIDRTGSRRCNKGVRMGTTEPLRGLRGSATAVTGRCVVIFECPACGRVTSSSFSMETGGYWRKYSRRGPWGCVSCGLRLDVTCQEPMCGAVGTALTIPNGYCRSCQITTCEHCGGKADRQYLVGNLCCACRRLNVQCRCPGCGAMVTFPQDRQGCDATCPACSVPLVVPLLSRTKLLSGQKAPRSGEYSCGRCGPDGDAAEFVRQTESGDIQQKADAQNPLAGLLVSVVGARQIEGARKQAAMPAVIKTLAQGDPFPPCPNGCGQSAHWVMQNPAAKGATLADGTDAVREYVVTAADREGAIARAIEAGAQPDGLVAVLQDRKEESGVVVGKAAGQDAATAAATAGLPPSAVATAAPEISQEAGAGQQMIKAADEDHARANWQQAQPAGASTTAFSCEQQPRPGLLGLFRRDGIWSAAWSRECEVRIRYRIPGQFTVRAIGRMSS
jgi:hypothetical protein